MASTQNVSSFNEHDLLHDLKHYLPTQAPLKDFIHHNTLHAFQQQNFFEAITSASKIFGYKTTLSIDDFRSFYKDKKINPAVLNSVIIEKKGKENLTEWTRILFDEKFDENVAARIGLLHSNWRKIYNIDLETFVLPILFRIVCSYLDQGVSIWSFPQDKNKGFLDNMLEIDQNSHANIFTSKRVKSIIAKGNISIKSLLEILIGKDESLYYQYIFDQQFLHQGWSGMVSSVEDLPQTLLINKKISLKEFIIFELLLEIDTLDSRLGEKWLPLGERLKERPPFLFDKVAPSQLDEALQLWQLAFEWSWYDQVLTGLQLEKINKKIISNKSFQGVFCIDDRECSFRRYLETFDSNCETFSTAGFFGVEFFFKPNGGKFVTKVCPAPITPKHLIKEVSDKLNYQRDVHFSKESHSIFFGWFISQTLGFWSALKLFVSLFKPSMSPATASSLKHMDKNSTLIIEHENQPNENDLKVGFSIDEMVTRVENVLRSIGMVKDFAPIVYIVGHGASSVNNPHYAAYDCGACSGRAGSVNARVFSFMANHPKVRAALVERGIIIPNETEFVGGIRDTTRDEVVFF